MGMKDRLYEVPVVGTAMKVQDRYKIDAGDQFAGAIGFFGFLSLFPLLILALSVVGFVLAGESQAEVAVITRRIQDAIPGFSAVLGDGETSVATAIRSIIDNRGSIGLIGLVTLVVSGLRVINAAQTAMLKIFRIDILDVPGWKLKVQQLGTLLGLGVLAVLSFGVSSAVGAITGFGLVGPLAVLAPTVGLVTGFALDVAFFLAAYRIFATADGPHWRTFVPGAILAGVGWTLLKTLGSSYVSGQVESNSQLYGALGGVIALLLLLYLAGRLYIYGAELSAVLHPPADEDWDPHDDIDEDGSPIRSTEDVPGASTAGPEVAAAAAHAGAAAEGRTRQGVEREARAARLAEDEPAPTVSVATTHRLAAADATRRAEDEPGTRQGIALLIAVGAVAGLAAVTKPWKQDS